MAQTDPHPPLTLSDEQWRRRHAAGDAILRRYGVADWSHAPSEARP